MSETGAENRNPDKSRENAEASLAFDRRLDAVLKLLLEASLDEHPEILRRECRGDRELEAEARALLVVALDEEAQETSARFKPVFNLDRGFGTPPEQLGAYRVLGEIGRGGMGVVYLAERDDGSYTHRVAIKLLNDLSGREAKRRFLVERQILAELDHPGIARILDGGVTDEGRPFFVMDFVEGTSIERFAEQEELGLTERIELVLELCEAVESAHRALVVHRDIKPSNVLVDSDGRVRLLDFGIAKILEGSSLDTQTGQHAMTPQYAPPEQYQGKAATVASDVYQLGLLTYELIARRRPYDLSNSTPAESIRVVCEERPEPPSMVRVENAEPLDISPDLDLILMKALHKEPERRYSTVERLADDLRRYLNREPVAARPDSSAYRLRLFCIRNASVVVLTSVALVAGLVGAAWFMRSLALERQATELQAIRAASERDRAEKTVAFLVNVLAKADPFFSPDADVSVREALGRGAIELESDWEGSPQDRARLLEVVALIEGRLGMHSESVGHARQALELMRATTAEGGRGPDSEAEVRIALVLAGALRKDLRSAESLVVLKDVVGAEGLSSLALPADLQADYLANLAEALFGESDLEAAEEAFRESIQVSSTDRHGAEFALAGLGELLMVRGRPQEALPYLEQALERRSARLGPDHVTLHELHGRLGNVMVEAGRFDEAVEHHRRALALLEMRHLGDHQTRVATIANLGIALNASGEHSEAEVFQRQALEMARRIDSVFEGAILTSLANTIATGNPSSSEAESLHRQAVASFESRFGTEHWRVGLGLNNLGEVLEAQGRLEESERVLLRSRKLYVAAFGDQHPFVSHPLVTLARIAAKRGETASARANLEQALAIREASYGQDAAETEEVRVALAALEKD